MQMFSFFDASKVGSSVIYLDLGETLLDQGIQQTIATILEYVEEHQPAIVIMEGFKTIHDLIREPVEERKFVYELAVRLSTWGVTSILVGEYSQREIEEEAIFSIADAIIRLHNQLQAEHYQRYVDVIKMRGENYSRGLHPFTISADGLSVYPRIGTPEVFTPYDLIPDRIPIGLPELDTMLEGGLPAGSTTMVAGSAGTGKTIIGLHFIIAGTRSGQPGVIVTLQENPVQLQGIAKSFGWDLQALQAQGLLVHLYHSPVELQPDIHATLIKDAVRRVGARRIFFDLISDIELATLDKVRYKDYIYTLVNDFKVGGVTAVMASELPQLFGPFQLSEHGISYITDNVILLRYMELFGRMRRAISIMKVRGSQHSKEIREYEITAQGMHIGAPVQMLTGVMASTPVVHENGYLRHLPSHSRHIVETMAQRQASTLHQLEQDTGLAQEKLREELNLLQQQGIVLAISRDDGVYYRTTI
jgi:circadian clock protein KaiC